MDRTTTRDRIASALKRTLVLALRPLRTLVGRLLQLVERNRLQELRDETARLGSASVESVTYLGREVRQLDDRLSKLENELAAIRAILEEGETLERGESETQPATRSA